MFEISTSSRNSISPKVKRSTRRSDHLSAKGRILMLAQLGLTSAPTVQFHPAASGPNKSNKLSVITYDLNRK